MTKQEKLFDSLSFHLSRFQEIGSRFQNNESTEFNLDIPEIFKNAATIIQEVFDLKNCYNPNENIQNLITNLRYELIQKEKIFVQTTEAQMAIISKEIEKMYSRVNILEQKIQEDTLTIPPVFAKAFELVKNNFQNVIEKTRLILKKKENHLLLKKQILKI